MREILESNGAALGVARVEKEEPTVLSVKRVRQTLRRNIEYLQQTGYLFDPNNPEEEDEQRGGDDARQRRRHRAKVEQEEGMVERARANGRRNGCHDYNVDRT